MLEVQETVVTPPPDTLKIIKWSCCLSFGWPRLQPSVSNCSLLGAHRAAPLQPDRKSRGLGGDNAKGPRKAAHKYC